MNKSESIAALAAALAKAQAEMGPAKKDAVNPHYKSKYADFSSVWEAARTVLPKHGLAVVQTNADTDRGVCVETMLVHSSGEWISGRLTLPVSKADAQGHGSAITYARRYGLAAIVCMAADEDDDANAAVQRSAPSVSAAPAIKRDWSAFETEIIGRIHAAEDDSAVLQIAREVHEARPPKTHRDAIANAYTAKIASLTKPANGKAHAASHG